MLAARDDWTESFQSFQSLLACSLRAGGHCGHWCLYLRVLTTWKARSWFSGHKHSPFQLTRKDNCFLRSSKLISNIFRTNFSVTLKLPERTHSPVAPQSVFFFLPLLYFCLFSPDSVASAAPLNSKPPKPTETSGVSTFKELVITCTVGKWCAVAATQRIVCWMKGR